MKKKGVQIILISVIVILAAYILIQKSGKTHYTLPALPRIESKDVTKLSLKKKDSEITLRRQGGKWILDPQGYPADGAAVDGMIANIAGLSLSALVSESGSPANYDLDPERRIEVAAFAGDSVMRSFAVGKTASAGRHTFVTLDKGAGVYHADGDLRGVFDTTVSRLRDKTVLKIDEEIKSLTLKQGTSELKLLLADTTTAKDAKKGDGAKAGSSGEDATPQRWKTANGKPANDREADDLVSTLRDLNCDDFIEGKKKSDYSKPVFIVTATGAKEYRLTLFKEKDNSYTALSSENEYPFRLSEWKAKKIMKEFGALAATK